MIYNVKDETKPILTHIVIYNASDTTSITKIKTIQVKTLNNKLSVSSNSIIINENIFAIAYSNSRSLVSLEFKLKIFSWILVLYGLLQIMGLDFVTLDTKGLLKIVLTYGNSNFAGGMLSVLFGYHFTYFMQTRKKSFSHVTLWLALLIGVISAAAVQGYMIIAFVILLNITLISVDKFKSRIVNITVITSWVVGIVLTLLGVSGRTVFAQIFARESFQARIEYWKVTWRIIQDNFLFGIGPDKLYDASSPYMSPGSLKIITTTRMDNAHNWFLNITVN